MNNNANVPGKGLLIGSGVIMIIFAILELIAAVALSNAPFAIRIALELATGLPIGAIVGIAWISVVLYGVLGIIALIYCGNHEKAWYLFLEGIGALVLQIIFIITIGRHMGINILTFLGPAVVILFIIGAYMNKEARQLEPESPSYPTNNKQTPANIAFCTSCGAKLIGENLAFCQSCGAKVQAGASQQKQDVWTCIQCGDENPYVLTTCKSCRVDMPENMKPAMPAQKAKVWKCARCGDENPQILATCKACRVDRPTYVKFIDKDPVLNQSKTWRCPHCYRENKITNRKCSDCGRDK